MGAETQKTRTGDNGAIDVDAVVLSASVSDLLVRAEDDSGTNPPGYRGALIVALRTAMHDERTIGDLVLARHVGALLLHVLGRDED